MDDTASASTSNDADRQTQALDLHELISIMRPKLHRYCARMVGSSIEGEDVVQDAMVKALEALPRSGHIENPSAWLFRIAHNRALDVLRARARAGEIEMNDQMEELADNDRFDDRLENASVGLRTLAQLPVRQRSCIILKDVIGHSLKEASSILEISVPTIKAELHRGRAYLKELALKPDKRPDPQLPSETRARLSAYIDRFNARDFDAIREMLASEVKIEAVAQTTFIGRRESAGYFHNYEKLSGWKSAPALVDGYPAALVHLPDDTPGEPSYFIILGWTGDGLRTIRDFYHARYALETAEIVRLE